MNLGWTEIILIVVVGMVLFGPKRLPQLGKSMGQAIRGFKKGLTDEVDTDFDADEKEVSQSLAHKPNEAMKTSAREKEEQKHS